MKRKTCTHCAHLRRELDNANALLSETRAVKQHLALGIDTLRAHRDEMMQREIAAKKVIADLRQELDNVAALSVRHGDGS